MPRRDDLKKILIIGSGPIVIGQACEFDYSGTQACKALREEGYEVVLVNSNPATIMTDPATADRTYIEPLTWEIVAKVIEKERPDALLPTLGGQTGLNVAMDLSRHGVLEKFDVEMIGANADVIDKAESRERFQKAMNKIGLDVSRGRTVQTLAEAREWLKEIGLPTVIRASFTMGGSGSAIAFEDEEFDRLVKRGLEMSPVHQILIEESIIGWKEYEMEVMRDKDDNVVIICSIENFDPMGIHTGDSITVAPAQTLTDKEYQRMRDASLAVIREIGVETGGSNIQFAIHPDTGRMIVIEMNPRVSRSSALASKATGFPIAKIAAKLAVGYRLHELPNDITRETTACFEPSIDYVVTKVPRFAFEKFPDADATLTTQMKSVGETMAIGSTFKESFQKALRGLEVKSDGFGCDRLDLWDTPSSPTKQQIIAKLTKPGAERVWYLRYAFKSGMDVAKVYELTGIDPWFLDNLHEIFETEEDAPNHRQRARFSGRELKRTHQRPTPHRQTPRLLGSPACAHLRTTESEVRKERLRLGIRATFKSVDTCAAEFEAYTPYYYSTYEEEDEIPPKEVRAQRIHDRANPSGPRPSTLDPRPTADPRPLKSIIILGGGPNRIGQGIEFDYCCCHASFALKELGIESVMVNSNPETVSTDYDTSDMLFFEPLTVEDVLNICDRVQPDGVIVQFGGQTPLNLARALEGRGRADHRHECRCDRSGRRSRKISAVAAQTQLAAAAQRHRPQHGRGTARSGESRLSAARAAKLRARRPGDGDLLRRRADGAVCRRGIRRGRRPAGADRSVLGRRNGSRRRLHQRRHDGHRARHHGAHRRSRRPLGRLGLRDSAVQFAGPGDRRDSQGDRGARARAQCYRPDERAVRSAMGGMQEARMQGAGTRDSCRGCYDLAGIMFRLSTCSKLIPAPAAPCRL